uniref:Secreted protein n=1 Tax=Steinernema glaseri TaxID=37863 RepID=A0A1I8A7P6_9BILA
MKLLTADVPSLPELCCLMLQGVVPLLRTAHEVVDVKKVAERAELVAQPHRTDLARHEDLAHLPTDDEQLCGAKHGGIVANELHFAGEVAEDGPLGAV